MSLYEASNLTKTYGESTARVRALAGLSLCIEEGEFVVVLGASGSGKTTLLNMLGCMDKPSGGRLTFLGEDIAAFDRARMTRFRGENIGFVFQSYNLLPDLTALENVEFSTEMARLPRGEAEQALAWVGLSDRMHHFPAQLSGGEQQRVSIARAIAKRPRVLLCDEPTGALDFETGIRVLDVLRRIHRDRGTTVVLITHNQAIARIADRVVHMRSGEILRVERNESPLAPSEVVW